MSRLQKWFGKLGKSRPASSRRNAQARLKLEQLDDRLVPSTLVTNHGGLVIPHVQVENVYYGEDWYQPANQTMRQQLNQFTATIVKGSYMSMLGEYGVGRGSFVKDDVVDDIQSTWGNTVTESQIQNMLKNEIQPYVGAPWGYLDEANASRLYVVYLPPNVHSQQDLTYGTYGHHNSFTMTYWHEVPTTWGPVFYPTTDTVYYAVITSPVGNTPNLNLLSGYTPFQRLTAETTHELAEAVTDPDLQHGWYLNDASHEIGDLVDEQVGWLDGYLVQRQWSNVFQRGELPAWDVDYSWNEPVNMYGLYSTSSWPKSAWLGQGAYTHDLYWNWDTGAFNPSDWYVPA
jgi:hypothetical protein